MKVEFGKMYVRRDGVVTDGLIENTTGAHTETHPFMDPIRKNSYRKDGSYFNKESSSQMDLVAEWVEPVEISTSECGRAPSAEVASKYHRTVPSTSIDIYDVIVAWDIRCPARQQALKKIMCAGDRGAKGVHQDLNEAIQAIARAKELAR